MGVDGFFIKNHLHIDSRTLLKLEEILRFPQGSAKVTGGPPGLQIQCGALEPSQVSSILMHFRHFISKFRFLSKIFL